MFLLDLRLWFRLSRAYNAGPDELSLITSTH